MFVDTYDAIANKVQPVILLLDLLVDGKHISTEYALQAQNGIYELLKWAKDRPHDWQYNGEPDVHSEQMKVVDYLCENTEKMYYRGYEFGEYLRYVRNRLAAAEQAARGMRKVAERMQKK